MKNKFQILLFLTVIFLSNIWLGKATEVHAPSLVATVDNLAVDKETRKQIYEQFVEIKNQIAEDPKGLLPILWEVILSATTGNTAEQWKSTVDGAADNGERTHLTTRGTGNAIITAVAGVAMVKNLPEIAKNLAENIKKVKNINKVFGSAKEMVSSINDSRKTIRKVLNMDAGKEYAKKYFDNIVKDGNFDDWYANTFKKYDLDEPLNFEVHHVIPVNVLKNNKELQELLFKFQDRFDFNSIANGISLQKKRLKFDQSGHTNHPDYDKVIRERVANIMDNPIDDVEKFNQFKELINKAKDKLEIDVLLGNKDVNQILNF